jgi:NAD(P)-dependent dehydrogenase (short-subunit alcohol dehydrogenase family)
VERTRRGIPIEPLPQDLYRTLAIGCFMQSMTRCWAREIAERCMVNAVNPGPLEGDMHTQAGEGFWKTMQEWQDNSPLAGVPADSGGLRLASPH